MHSNLFFNVGISKSKKFLKGLLLENILYIWYLYIAENYLSDS